MITSLDNKKVKEISKLHQKKYRKDSFLLTNLDLILLAKEKNLLKEVLYVNNLPFEFANAYEVSKEVMNKIDPDTDIVASAFLIKEKDDYKNRVIILDDLQDPLNVGRIFECMGLFGYDSLILSNNSADIYNEKCLNNSKGYLFDVNIKRTDIKNEIFKLKDLGFKVYATGLSGNDLFLNEVKEDKKMAFILGNEGSGVKKEIMDLCDSTIKIEMENIDSLNVAMAGSIIMYNFSNNEL